MLSETQQAVVDYVREKGGRAVLFGGTRTLMFDRNQNAHCSVRTIKALMKKNILVADHSDGTPEPWYKFTENYSPIENN